MCQSILAIPFKHAEQRTIEYLEHNEMQTLLEASDRATGAGPRDYAEMLEFTGHQPILRTKFLFTPQQLCLLDLSTNTWLRRGEARRNSLSFNEEAVTELLLVDLAVHFPGTVKIIPFTKKQEAETGADWAWAFVGPDGKSCQSMLVQAKRLDDRGRAYTELYYRGRSSGPAGPKSQLDTLLATARRYRLPPIYAFYNHLDNIGRIPAGSCGSLYMARSRYPESWGVSIAPATEVHKAKPDKSFDCHRRHSRPLHCLLCSQGTGQQHEKGSAGAAAAALSAMFGRVTKDEGSWPGFDLPFRPEEGLPELFQHAERVHFERTEEVREEAFPSAGADFPGIAGAVILRDHEVGESLYDVADRGWME